MLRTIIIRAPFFVSHVNLARFLCVILCLAFFTGGNIYPAMAAENTSPKNQDDTMFNAAEEFASCAGAYEAVAQVMKKAGNKNLSVASHEKANGARLAGIWFASSVTDHPDSFIAEKANTSETNWLALFEGSDPELTSQSMENLGKRVVTCSQKYGEIQGKIVQAIRRAAYERKSKETK